MVKVVCSAIHWLLVFQTKLWLDIKNQQFTWGRPVLWFVNSGLTVSWSMLELIPGNPAHDLKNARETAERYQHGHGDFFPRGLARNDWFNANGECYNSFGIDPLYSNSLFTNDQWCWTGRRLSIRGSSRGPAPHATNARCGLPEGILGASRISWSW